MPVVRTATKIRPASARVIADRLGILFAAMPSQVRSDEATRAKAYLYALEGVSAEALDSVVRDVLRGSIPSLSPTFAPTPPELSRLCRELEAAIEAQALPPPAEPVVLKDISPAERERMVERFNSLRITLQTIE